MLADNIKIIRRNKGYSQEELAEKIHVTRQTISKWENGQSVPTADLLKAMAEILGVSVSELMDGNAEKIAENEVIIDQLARINEQLIINHRRAKKRVFIIVAVCIAVIATIVSFLAVRTVKEKGRMVSGHEEHLGVLTYTMPYRSDCLLYHRKNDVGVTHERDGRQRISSKLYRCYEDMTKIIVTNCGTFDQERIDEFIKDHPNAVDHFIGEYEKLPTETEYFIAATDAGVDEDGCDHIGSYYVAYIKLDGNLYFISVNNGYYIEYNAEWLISTMSVDMALEEEYLKEIAGPFPDMA